MSLTYLVGAIVSGCLLVYLIAALMKAEDL
ncbi:potassium-transporting ATPase subunit F [Pollutimonas sp. H1-120]